jgi:hypothetical protein
MKEITLFTTINYERHTSFSENVLSRLSNHFYLGGTKVTIFKENKVKFENGILSWRSSARKIVFFVLLFPITVISFAIYAGLLYWHRSAISASAKEENSTLNKADYIFRSKQNDRGSQEGCCGQVSKEEVEKFLPKLLRNPSPGISFDPMTVNDRSKIVGTCTAMSIKFAFNYFNLRKESVQPPGSLLFEDRLGALKDKFEISSKKMRSRQWTYSSIRVNSKEIDISKSKIESCIRSHGFEINYCSNEMDIAERDSWEKQFKKLDLGVYFIRMIQPNSNNAKLESFGHSMIYIREMDATYFYDNNIGLEKLSGIEKEKCLYDRLFAVHEKWKIPSMRLYRLFQPSRD